MFCANYFQNIEVKPKGKGKCIAVHGTLSHSYGVSLAMWDHTVLPATRHK